jgi:hypothetical protein
VNNALIDVIRNTMRVYGGAHYQWDAFVLPIARLSYQHATTNASDVKVEFAARRAGDPADLVAACSRAHSTLKWQPRFDDLQTIVAHALAWERKLQRLPARAVVTV